MAEDAGDFEVARTLCREWLDWRWRHYPSDWPTGPEHPKNPEKFEAIVKDLPLLHQRPRGGILIGSVDGQAIGCVMYHAAAPEVTEFKRMFVSRKVGAMGLVVSCLRRCSMNLSLTVT